MRFDSPIWLLALLGIPLLMALAWASRSRGRRYAVRFTAVSTLALVASESPRWRRFLPAALALAAIALLVLALAKPSDAQRIPIRRASIVLVTDHSGSMSANDVSPTRLAAAEKAADTFIDQLPASAKVGVVAYSDTPDAVQAPSTDHSLAKSAIGAQTALGSTATGDALLAAIRMLRQDPEHPPSAIVLLSDGRTTAGSDPVAAARLAARNHIPIETVALGTPGAVIQTPDGPVSVAPDPVTLRSIATTSHGQAFTAGDADHLSSIYKELGSRLGSRTRRHDVSSGFALGGLALLLGAGLVALGVSGRLP